MPEAQATGGLASRPAAAVPVSLGLVSVSVIAFQLVIMQMLSISQWHHFAYMVISMAMLGFGAAGTVISLFRDALTRRYAVVLPLLYVITAISIPLATRVSTGVAGFDSYLLFFDPGQIGLLFLSYCAFAFPFFTAGLAVTIAFTCEVERVDRLYFANLLGSGLGSPTIVIMLSLVPLQHQAPLLALLPLAAAWITRPKPVRERRFMIPLFAAAALAVISGLVRPVEIRPSQYKDVSAAMLLPDAELIHRSDSPYGRIEVLSSPAQRFSAGFSLLSREEPPVSDVMFVDGNYYGTLLGRGRNGNGHVLDATTQGLPYSMRRPERVMVLGAATGAEVSHALAHGAQTVTAVEPNRRANRLLRVEHPEWIDSLYLDPRVELHGESPRTYLARRDERTYDLIVTPMLGAFGGETGVAALAERYELTMEAFSRMYELLSPGGMIATSVWVDTPPRALLRVLGTWRAVLTERGITDARGYVAAVRSWATVTLVLSRSVLDAEELPALRSFAAGLNFDPLVLPGIQPGERDRYNRLPDTGIFEAVDALVEGDPDTVYRDYIFDVAPVTDDRPLFGRFMRLTDLPRLAQIYGIRTVPYLELGTVLAGVTFVQIAVAALVLVILPLLRLGWKSKGRGWTFLTFSGLGLGFMFFEIVLIQHLVLYLGQPVYATAAVLAVLLVALGCGSLLSLRFRGRRNPMAVIGTCIALLIAVYAFGLMPVVRHTIAWPFTAKIPIVLALLAGPALLMGMMFPLGLQRLAGTRASHIPWACAIDSALSVSATALATLIALGGGFTMVLAVAAAAYALSALTSLRLGAG